MIGQPDEIKGFGASQFARLAELVNDEIAFKAGLVLDGASEVRDPTVVHELADLFALRLHIKREQSLVE